MKKSSNISDFVGFYKASCEDNTFESSENWNKNNCEECSSVWSSLENETESQKEHECLQKEQIESDSMAQLKKRI